MIKKKEKNNVANCTNKDVNNALICCAKDVNDIEDDDFENVVKNVVFDVQFMKMKEVKNNNVVVS